MPLPTNIDATYPDRTPGDALHQQHHDAIHQAINDLGITYAPRYGLVDDLIAAAQPFYVAHRGGYLLNPEHSMEAYRAAFESNFLIEQDIEVLVDGTLVCLHDSTVDRTMTGTGDVSTLTLAQWRAMLQEPPIPGGIYTRPIEWSQVLSTFGGRSILVPEVKDSNALSSLIASIVDKGHERNVIIQSFTYSHCQTAVAAGIPALFLSNSAAPATLVADGVKFVGCSTAATPAYISSLTAAGIIVVPYTINTRATATTFLGYGCQGMFSDDPWHVADRANKRDTDNFAAKALWPGWGGGVTSFRWRRLDEFGQGDEGGAGVNNPIALRWAGLRGPLVRVRWRVRYMPTSVTDLTRWCGSMYVGTEASEDVPFADNGAPGHNGYHAFVRRNGDLHLFRVDNGVASQIGVDTTDPDIAANTTEGFVDLELTINATGVIFKNLTTGKTITTTDVVHRSSNARLTSKWNNNVGTISRISVEDLF